MKKFFYTCSIAATLFAVCSCSSDSNEPEFPQTPEANTKSLYVIPAVVGEASYLITAESLESGEVTV